MSLRNYLPSLEILLSFDKNAFLVAIKVVASATNFLLVFRISEPLAPSKNGFPVSLTKLLTI